MKKIFAIIFVLSLCFLSCKKDEGNTYSEVEYTVQIGEWQFNHGISFNIKSVTDERVPPGITLSNLSGKANIQFEVKNNTNGEKTIYLCDDVDNVIKFDKFTVTIDEILPAPKLDVIILEEDYKIKLRIRRKLGPENITNN
ncbi:MAG: hypothetical protein N4A74_24460 [Carboxylicivirga sp.]|jgi:hypothetical protein|nr:hypothetical protein [Carboxylicivirga sp.]